MMKKFYTLTSVLMCLMFAFSMQTNAQTAEMFQTYIVYDLDASGNAFYAGGLNADAAATYDGTNFGTPTSLTLNGGEIKTYKNSGGDVTGAMIWYNIHTVGSSPGVFTAINLPWDSNIGGAPLAEDQKWKEEFAGVDVLAGLAPGDYELEVYWQITTNIGDRFDSNFGANFSGTFTVAAAAVPTLGQWGLIILGLILLCTGAVVVWSRQYKLKEVKA